MAGKQWENQCHTVSSCALAGAATFFAGIPDAFVVANGPAWCYFYALRKVERPDNRMAQRFFSTYADNGSVVFGTEEKLSAALDLVASMTPPPQVMLVENSCAISLIGDDIAGITANHGLPCPAVTMDSGGLVGGHWEGYRKAALEYFRKMPIDTTVAGVKKTVNFLGSDASYLYENDDMDELRRMLGKIGVHVHAVVGNGANVETLKTLKKAELNIVIHPECGELLARFLQEEYDMPYLMLPLPYGMEATEKWVRCIGEALSLPEDAYRDIDAEIAATEEKLYRYTRDAQKVWGEPWFDTVLVCGPSSVAYGIAGAVRTEWADTAKLEVFTHDEREKNSEVVYPSGHEMATSAGVLVELLQACAGLVLGSGHERKIITEQAVSQWRFAAIAQPDPLTVTLTTHPQMGIVGTCVMAQEIWREHMTSHYMGKIS